jgi:ribosome maturation factor RimP
MSAASKAEIEAKIGEIAQQVGDAAGIEIAGLELLGGGAARVLRIYIDRPEGVSHQDCKLISDQVGAILDEQDVIPGAGYTLEVSSPGVERPLLKAQDYTRFLGKKVKVALREPMEGQRSWQGVLKDVSGNVVTLEAAGGKTVSFSLDKVERANLKFEW